MVQRLNADTDTKTQLSLKPITGDINARKSSIGVMIHEDFEFQLVAFESFPVHLIVHLESLIVCQV